jgi:hypothetical protein
MSRTPLVPLALALALVACNKSPTEPQFPDAVLTGTVTFVETGAPVANARVTALLTQIHGSAQGEARADAEGRYSLRVPGGQYSVSVFEPGADRAALIDQYDLVPGRNPVNFRISADGCVTMSGRVIDIVSNMGVTGATITFFDQRVVSAADGAYALHLGCPPRPRTASEVITIEHPQYQRREFLIGVPTYSTTSDIVLQPR